MGEQVFETIAYEVADHIATVTLNRPGSMNAINDQLTTELHHAMQAAARDPKVRAIILTGAGRAFCAGGDITGFGGQAPSDLITKLPRHFDMNQPPDYQTRHSYFPAIEKPIIGMINGPVAGLGLLYALFCDVRLASDTAFTTAFARRGLGAEYGMAWILEQVVGHANSLDLLLSGRKVLGAEALRLGLANQIYPLAELKEATSAYVKELVTWCAPSSMRMMKRALYQVPFQSLHEAVMLANQDMLTSNVSPDFKEAPRASGKSARPASRILVRRHSTHDPKQRHSAIHRRRDGHVFFVVIDRPAKMNGFTPAMLRALAYAFTDFERDNDARCLVLSANGPHSRPGWICQKYHRPGQPAKRSTRKTQSTSSTCAGPGAQNP